MINNLDLVKEFLLTKISWKDFYVKEVFQSQGSTFAHCEYWSNEYALCETKITQIDLDDWYYWLASRREQIISNFIQ
jgi:hypothetical protein